MELKKYLCNLEHCAFKNIIISRILTTKLLPSSPVHSTSGAQLGGKGGGRSPLPYFENGKKKCPDFVKNALTVTILELHFPFTM